jgi:ubiquinone/menaquinone biosynthesis C-methylase UbiE
MIVVFLLIFCISCALSIVINIGFVRVILIVISVISGTLFIYTGYAYWLLWKNNGGLQKQLCNTLLDSLEWDGQGKALDIGTGSGRVAIYLAKRYQSAHVAGIDYWGNPWTYSKSICDRNAEIEGVADRVIFQRASAVSLPYEDGEYDLVISNFVFHSVRVINKTSLIKEALRVIKKGGAFAFQDLFNKQFYGDIDLFYEELKTWGLKEVKLIDTSDFVYIPVALRINHMLGNSRILYGIK